MEFLPIMFVAIVFMVVGGTAVKLFWPTKEYVKIEDNWERRLNKKRKFGSNLFFHWTKTNGGCHLAFTDAAIMEAKERAEQNLEDIS